TWEGPMFKVMTWNVENLFRPGGAYGPKTQAAYAAKLAGLASRINEQAPDALSLQEIGEPAALDDLEGLLDATWHRHVSTHPDLPREPVRTQGQGRPSPVRGLRPVPAGRGGRHHPSVGDRGPGERGGGPGGGAHRGLQRRRPGRHHPAAPGPAGLGDRDSRVR